MMIEWPGGGSLAGPLLETYLDALLETLNAKLHEWKPETAAQVRERVTEIINLADQDGLDLLRSRAMEQEVLDTLVLDTPGSGYPG